MRNIVNPRQKLLFDPFDVVLTDKWRNQLLNDWQGVFRNVILELLPVKELGAGFSPSMGRPTKELYSVAGLLLIKEFKNWTKQDAVDAYCLNIGVQYALNLEPKAHDMTVRTLERYIKRFVEEDLGKKVMEQVTATLINTLECNIDKQRLDSTHIFSDMASFGRTRLMAVALKRMLTQLKRHHKKEYDSLDEDFRKRYQPGANQLFSDWGEDKDSRCRLRQQVAEDMHYLLQRLAGKSQITGGNSYKALERIFYEQCDVEEQKITVKKNTGGNVMQNPSDPDATYDGHKGQGYQAQLTETYSPDNEQQFITNAIVETACQPDSQSVEPILEELKENELLPEEMLADSAYCGDENVVLAEEAGVELVGPVPGNSKKEDQYECITIDDFNIDEASEEVVCCPAGNKPESSEQDKETGKTKTVMSSDDCGNCEFFEQCPAKRCRKQYVLEHTAKDRRIAARRREQDTDVFRERYRPRSAIEGTNSGVKRKTGLDRLRVRGFKAVSNAAYLKIAGWNILRATGCAKMREIVAKRAYNALLRLILLISELKKGLRAPQKRNESQAGLKFTNFASNQKISLKAA